MIPAKYIDKEIFTVTGKQTSTFSIGRVVRAVCGDEIRVGTVSRSYTSDNDTIVVLSSKSDLLTKELTEVEVGITPVVDQFLNTGLAGISEILNDAMIPVNDKLDLIADLIDNLDCSDPSNISITTDIEYITPPIRTPYIKQETKTTTINGVSCSTVNRDPLTMVELYPTAGGMKYASLPTNNVYCRLPNNQITW
jgi:hypothetical protein